MIECSLPNLDLGDWNFKRVWIISIVSDDIQNNGNNISTVNIYHQCIKNPPKFSMISTDLGNIHNASCLFFDGRNASVYIFLSQLCLKSIKILLKITIQQTKIMSHNKSGLHKS